MRYIFIFSITAILALFIMFYNPYLGVYKDTITITLEDNIDGYSWKYDIDNDSLQLVDQNNNKWTFKTNNNGTSNLYLRYVNNENTKYEIYYKLKVNNNKIYWLEGYGKGLLSYPNPK